MPDVVIHAAFGREVRDSLAPDIRSRLADAPFSFALLGPDIWFTYQLWKRREGRGRWMHTTVPGAFLAALADRAKSSSARDDLFSYLAGFLCHYAMDSTAHPYIIYMTEEVYHYPRCHLSFERSLDVLELRRASRWGQAHPVTRDYYPAAPLPESIREDIDAVYESVYGWKNCWKLLNRSSRRFRLFYRIMENPKGWYSRLARLIGSPAMKSFTYSESHFNDTDVENLAKKEWRHSHDAGLSFTSSFPEMRKEARKMAVRLITAAYRYVYLSDMSREDLTDAIGNRSYLSGLPADDPRNLSRPSMLPPESSLNTASPAGGDSR